MTKIKKHYLEIIFFVLFVVTRIPDLGHDVFNTDVWKWKARTYDFGTGVFTLDFEKTIQKYHPGVTLMWLGTFAVKAYNLYASLSKDNSLTEGLGLIFGLHFTQKLFVTFAIGFSLSVAFYVLRSLFGLKYALISAAFLVLDPFYIGLTRVFHLEGLMSSFMLSSFLLFYWFLKERKTGRLIYSGIFAGLAILTKTSAVYMIPFFGLALLMDFLMTGRKSLGKYVKALVFVVFITLLTFVILWPAMWTYPLKALNELYRGVFSVGVEQDHEQFYYGKFVGDPGVSFYFVVLALKSSVYLIPGLVGYAFVRKRMNKDEKRFVLFCFAFAAFYFVQLSIPSKKLDRYILPSLIALILISSFFYYKLIDGLKKTYYAALVLLFLPAAFFMVRLHPDYFAYYSPYFGGLKKGIFVIEPKWMFGQREIIEALRTIDPPFVFSTFSENIDALGERDLSERRVVGFQEKYYTQIWPFVKESGMIPVIASLTPHANKAEFFVYPVWDDSSHLENRFSLKLVKPVYFNDAEVYRIYQKIN
ncbi:MAG: glycosyltransferase family 39 protein [Patescibacteria group bacterium]|jgi:hypothetical protein